MHAKLWFVCLQRSHCTFFTQHNVLSHKMYRHVKVMLLLHLNEAPLHEDVLWSDGPSHSQPPHRTEVNGRTWLPGRYTLEARAPAGSGWTSQPLWKLKTVSQHDSNHNHTAVCSRQGNLHPLRRLFKSPSIWCFRVYINKQQFSGNNNWISRWVSCTF